jgi:hypothetical protein
MSKHSAAEYVPAPSLGDRLGLWEGAAAGTGEMLNIHDPKAAYEKGIGHATSNSTV